MLSFITAFGVSCFYIWLKAFQQLSVQHDKYLWVPPVSLCMALCEVTIITLIVSQSFWVFIPVGLGGGIGCMGAMYMHKRMRRS